MATQAVGAPGSAVPSVKKPNSPFASKNAQEWLAGFAFIAPAAIVLFVFIFIPVVFALILSFTNWTGIQPPGEAQGVGLANYRALLTEDSNVRDEFFKSVKNTAYYVIGVVPLQTILALLLAMIVNQKFLKGRGFFRTAFYFPSITSSIVISIIFLWLFNHDGIINYFMGGIARAFGNDYNPITWTTDIHGVFHNFLGLFGLKLSTAPDWLKTSVLNHTLWDWLSGPSVAMFSIMLLTIWTTSGTLMLIFLAALQDIPGQLYEAASVDGATRWQQFRKITLPLLRPTTFFVITIGLIGTFQAFDQVYVISGGDGSPGGTTSTIALNVYRNGFKIFNAGLGDATAIVLFAMIMVVTLIQRRLTGNTSQA